MSARTLVVQRLQPARGRLARQQRPSLEAVRVDFRQNLEME